MGVSGFDSAGSDNDLHPNRLEPCLPGVEPRDRFVAGILHLNIDFLHATLALYWSWSCAYETGQMLGHFLFLYGRSYVRCASYLLQEQELSHIGTCPLLLAGLSDYNILCVCGLWNRIMGIIHLLGSREGNEGGVEGNEEV